MLKRNNLKICIVATSLNDGGTERFAATLSNILHNLGYNVFVLSTKDNIGYDYSGTLYNLEIQANSSNNFLKLFKMYSFFKKEKFDVIIDNRARRDFVKELLIYRFIYKRARIISMIHNYNIQNYFPSSKQKAKQIYRSNNTFVAVSKGIKEAVVETYGFNNVKVIYNPIDLNNTINNDVGEGNPLDHNYILYFGRLEEQSKNLTLLIKSYKNSKLKSKNIKLIIMGKGEDHNYLVNLVEELSLMDDVLFKPYNPNPFFYVKHALFTVLSSRYEGFPMSIIESLAIGTPVVSVDCKSGPSEIIIDGKNGLLTKNNDIEALSFAFDKFVNDDELYIKCKKNAQSSVRHLDVSEITKQWKTLLENEK